MITGYPDAGMGVLWMLGPSPEPTGTAKIFEGRAERKKRGWGLSHGVEEAKE